MANLKRDGFSENLGFPMKGVAQGGIVDTPEGDWYSVMYQEHGAIGKMPVLVPVSWDKNVRYSETMGKCQRRFG